MYSTTWNIYPIAKLTEDYTHWIKKTEKDSTREGMKEPKENF